MKKTFILTTLTILALATAQAQPRQSGGPNFGGELAKLFGDQQAFTAQIEIEMPDPASGNPLMMPGKMSFDSSKSRFEANISEIKGSSLPPEASAQLKAMGMDSMVTIARPDKKVTDVVYPGIQSYVEVPLTDKNGSDTADDFKSEATELGKETVDGHDCVKNKVVVTGKDGSKHESTVWNAKDLKNFPVKIESTEQGRKTVMSFKEVTFKKPGAGDFEVPAGFTKYSSPQEMAQAVMMKKVGGMMAPPPNH